MAREFEQPIQPRQKRNGKSEWSYRAPSYDQRTSRSIPAGDEYGVGYRTPVGKEKARSLEQGPIPMKTFSCRADEVIDAEV